MAKRRPSRRLQVRAGRPVGDDRIIRALQALVSHGFLEQGRGRGSDVPLA
jgi:hypothetical protein